MTALKTSLAAYVLAIESIEERINAAKNLCASLNLLGTFKQVLAVPAVFWKKPKKIVEFYSRFSEHTFTTNFLLNSRIGQVATSLSHISPWRRLIESERDGALVFEDDIYISDPLRFKCALIDLINYQEFDWARIHLHRRYRDEVLRRANGNLFIDDLMSWGFAAYYVSKSGARKMLEYCHNMDGPIDWLPPLLRQRGVLKTASATEVFVEHHKFDGEASQLVNRAEIELRPDTLQKAPSTIWTSPPVKQINELYEFLSRRAEISSQLTSATMAMQNNRYSAACEFDKHSTMKHRDERFEKWTFSSIRSGGNTLDRVNHFSIDNINSLRSDGITVLKGVFDEKRVLRARECVLRNRHLLKNTRVTPSSGHLAGFHRFPTLEPLHTMLACHPSINRFLESVLTSEKVRSIGLSDITVNRSQEWHNDLLRGKFRNYLDGVLSWDIDGGGVFKVLLYLQDSASLKYLKGSHLKPISLENDMLAKPTCHAKIDSVPVSAGDVVVMDIRCSHRGAEESFYAEGRHDANPRILISTVLGGINRKLTSAMEIGNFHRLQEWMARFP